MEISVENPHALSATDVLAKLDTSEAGLSAEDAAKRLERMGPNRLPNAAREGIFKRFFKHFHDVLIYILLAAAGVTAVLGHWVDTGVILGVVLVNAIIGFIQEGKAEQALEGIRKLLSLHALVRRDGHWVEIDAEDLVPGDRVRLKSGNRVPADLRLLQSVNLRIEESALTGESVPAEKTIDPVAADAGVGDRYGMAYSGTMVAAGHGVGVVTATGVGTELGRINRMIADVVKLETPLTQQMSRFGKILSYVIVGMAGLMLLAGRWLHDASMGELFLAAIGFAVAAIPEGLPAILTITLALGVQRMARRNAITRKLNAVETLGSVTVVCSDKTGTLTRNEMTVRRMATRGGRYSVSGTGYAPTGEITCEEEPAPLSRHPDLSALIETLALCNDARVVEENGQWHVIGTPTEGALRTLAAKAGLDVESGERIAVIPFESENKFMASAHRFPDGRVRLLMSGAPDRLLDRCSRQRKTDGSEEDLDRMFWDERIHEYSGEGLRVLAAACRETDEGLTDLSLEDVESGMTFLGVAAIIDPPREEAIEAIKVCRQAGIRVKMITGDHPGTATAIGREMGIGNNDHALSGSDIESASDEELRQQVQDHDIFARTSPEHKLRLVMALQASGEVVAMTGDGVNDAPALKRADVGVAMGIKGTEVTKEAAEIVLADDNFTSIEQAIEEGRTIFDNLRKAILFILPTNGAQGFVILAAVVFGRVLPLSPVQILWVNMVIAVTLALALAFEPAEPDVMRRPPRTPRAPVLGGVFLWRIGFVSVLIGGATLAVFLINLRSGMEIDLARTVAVSTLVCSQAFYLFNSRYLLESSFSLKRLLANPVAWLAVGLLALLHGLFVYAPFMHRLFRSEPMALRHWFVPMGVGLAVFLLVEAEKFILRRFGGSGTIPDNAATRKNRTKEVVQAPR